MSRRKKEFVVGRYGNTVDFENHLNELDGEDETALVAGRFTTVGYRLLSFSIDSRDGSIVAVYKRQA